MRAVQNTFAWLDQFDDHVVVTDVDAVVVYANKAAEAATGYQHDEVIGKKAGALWGGHMGHDFYERMWHTIKDQRKPFVGIVQNRRRSGDFYYAELRIYPVIDAHNRLQYFIGIEPDVTEAVTQNTLQENFVSLVKHELRNALGATKLMLGILAEDGLTQEQRLLVQSIEEENDRVQQTIDTLSLLGRSTDFLEEHVKPVSLHSLTQSIVDRIAGEKDALITQNIPHDIFVGSSGIVGHAVENVLSNAIKYSKEGSSICLTASVEGSNIHFLCEDAGIGIPEKEQAHLFDPFFRASNACSEAGTGVGLFVTRELLRKIGGTITVVSKIGTGTKVTICIPRLEANATH